MILSYLLKRSEVNSLPSNQRLFHKIFSQFSHFHGFFEFFQEKYATIRSTIRL